MSVFGEGDRTPYVKLMEELGISVENPVPMGHYVFESKVEKELVNVFRTVYDGPIHPSQDELAGGRFWTMQEIKDALGKKVMKLLMKMFGSALEIEHVSLSVKMKKPPTAKDIDRISEMFNSVGIDITEIEAKWIDVTAK